MCLAHIDCPSVFCFVFYRELWLLNRPWIFGSWLMMWRGLAALNSVGEYPVPYFFPVVLFACFLTKWKYESWKEDGIWTSPGYTSCCCLEHCCVFLSERHCNVEKVVKLRAFFWRSLPAAAVAGSIVTRWFRKVIWKWNRPWNTRQWSSLRRRCCCCCSAVKVPIERNTNVEVTLKPATEGPCCEILILFS